jgi:DNA primase
MRNDLHEIKKRLFDEDKIEELLEKLGCKNIRYVGGRFEAQLPNGKDKRSVQVYNNEKLSSAIRTRGISGEDIYSIVSYIKFGCETKQDRQDNLPEAKMWIVEEFDYHDIIDKYKNRKDVKDWNKWLKDLKKKRKKKRKIRDARPNSVLDESIKNSYLMLPYQGWVDEGIDLETQVEWEIGFDWVSKRIITIVRNMIGEIIGVKGRTLDPNYEEKDIPKYLYVERMDKSIELFGLNKTLPYILDKKELLLFEGYKSVFKSWQYDYKNCASIEGDDISDLQVNLIKSFGLDCSIVLCYDKDKTPDEIIEQAIKFTNRKVYIVYNFMGWLEGEKSSPVDEGVFLWEELYSQKMELTEFIQWNNKRKEKKKKKTVKTQKSS